MIPFIFVTIDEFKKVFYLKYKLIVYLRFVFWYIIYAGLVYIIIKWPFTYYDFELINFIFLASIIIVVNFLVRVFFIKLPPALKPDEVLDPTFRRNTSVLIPCHNSHDIIERTIKSVLRHYPEENVYIVENENAKKPSNTTTQSISMQYCVNYRFVPRGNKANAMKITLQEIKTEYVITLDDDTLFPEHFVPKEDYFLEDDRVAGVAFLIRMKDTDTVLQQVVDEDYKMYGYFNYTKNYSTNPFIVGIGGIWRTELYKLAVERNPAEDIVPYGNDGYDGMVMRLNNYKMKQDLQNHVLSYCPTKLFFSFDELLCREQKMSGYGATNIWKQRSLRWFRSSYAKLPVNIMMFFIYYSQGKTTKETILQNIHYRFHTLYSLLLSFWAIFVPIQIYYNLTDLVEYVLLHVGLYVIGLIIMLTCRYYLFRNRPDLLPKYKSIVLYPLFTTYVMLIRVCAFLGFLLFYLPVFLTPTFFYYPRYLESNLRKSMAQRQECKEITIENT